MARMLRPFTRAVTYTRWPHPFTAVVWPAMRWYIFDPVWAWSAAVVLLAVAGLVPAMRTSSLGSPSPGANAGAPRCGWRPGWSWAVRSPSSRSTCPCSPTTWCAPCGEASLWRTAAAVACCATFITLSVLTPTKTGSATWFTNGTQPCARGKNQRCGDGRSSSATDASVTVRTLKVCRILRVMEHWSRISVQDSSPFGYQEARWHGSQSKSDPC